MNESPLSLRMLKFFLAVLWWGLLGMGSVAIIWMASKSPDDLQLAMVGYASEIDTSVLEAKDRSGQSLEVEFDGPAKVKLLIPKGSMSFTHKAIGILLLALFFAACVYFVKQLRDIVRTIDQQDPFVSANARRVRMIGVLIVGFAIARGTTQLALSGYADAMVVPTGFNLDGRLEIPFGLLIAGIAVMVLSEVFRHGTRLREDQSLTI